MENGWIKLHRKVLNNPIHQRPIYFCVWIYMLLNANHEDNWIIWNNKKTLVKKGSYIGSLREISRHFKISIATVKYISDYLVSEHMIEHSANSKYSLFTILNWEIYQSIEHQVERQVNTNRTLGETNKNDKKVKNDKNNTAETSSADVVDVIDSFKDINGSFGNWYKNTTQRDAISRMLLVHGKEKILQVIKVLPISNKMPYIPTITTPIQLEEKWSALESGLTKKKIELLSKKNDRPIFT